MRIVNTRIVALLLALVLALGLLTGCGSMATEDRSAGAEEELHLVEDSDQAMQEEDPAPSDKPQIPSPSEQQEPENPETPAPGDQEEGDQGMPPAMDEPEEDDPDLSIPQGDAPEQEDEPEPAAAVTEDGEYSSPQEVADYIHLYGKLPSNFITKNKAKELGWDNSRGNLWDVAPGKSIGGDRFGNYEGLLPKTTKYRECDVNYSGGYRGSERIIYGEDGSVYYTDDHYSSFTQLY